MSFPAMQAFLDDPNVPWPPVAKVYRVLYCTLDGHEPRECKLEWLRHATGCDRSKISRYLDQLVAWGYLIEHPRDRQCPRRFTLTHSVRRDLRTAA